MTITKKQREGLGLALLNLSAWIRQQGWLRAIYRLFPASARAAASRALMRRAGEQVKFQRTPRWEREVLHPRGEQTYGVASGQFPVEAGVNVFAYIRGQFGLAESARLYTRALLGQGYPVAVHDIALDMAHTHSMDDASLDAYIGTDAPHGINLLFVNPDYLEAAVTTIGREKLGRRYTIGCWFWELEHFPEAWLPALADVDEIMVSSKFVGDLVRRVTEKPILHVPLPVLDMLDSGLTRSDFGLHDDAYVFLTSFDFNSFQARKNPLATIAAFRRAFAGAQRKVQLLVKSSNGHRHPERLRELLNAAAGDQRILVRDEIIGREHVQALQRCADAYVSLHRSEGFGLGLAECMRQGKPVIATAWSGNMEFMTPENSCLVDYNLVAVGEGEYIFHEGQRWAEPDIDHAARYMRRLLDEPEYGAQKGHRAAADVRENLSAAAVATALVRRLDEITSTRQEPRASWPVTPPIHS